MVVQSFDVLVSHWAWGPPSFSFGFYPCVQFNKALLRACVLSSLIVAFFHGSWFCCLRERETLCLFQGFLHMNCSRAWNSSDFRQMRFFWPSFHSSPLSFSFHVEMGPLAKKKLEEKGDRLSSWWKMLTFKYLLNRLHVSISTKLFKNHEKCLIWIFMPKYSFF